MKSGGLDGVGLLNKFVPRPLLAWGVFLIAKLPLGQRLSGTRRGHTVGRQSPGGLRVDQLLPKQKPRGETNKTSVPATL